MVLAYACDLLYLWQWWKLRSQMSTDSWGWGYPLVLTRRPFTQLGTGNTPRTLPPGTLMSLGLLCSPRKSPCSCSTVEWALEKSSCQQRQSTLAERGACRLSQCWLHWVRGEILLHAEGWRRLAEQRWPQGQEHVEQHSRWSEQWRGALIRVSITSMMVCLFLGL